MYGIKKIKTSLNSIMETEKRVVAEHFWPYTEIVVVVVEKKKSVILFQVSINIQFTTHFKDINVFFWKTSLVKKNHAPKQASVPYTHILKLRNAWLRKLLEFADRLVFNRDILFENIAMFN